MNLGKCIADMHEEKRKLEAVVQQARGRVGEEIARLEDWIELYEEIKQRREGGEECQQGHA